MGTSRWAAIFFLACVSLPSCRTTGKDSDSSASSDEDGVNLDVQVIKAKAAGNIMGYGDFDWGACTFRDKVPVDGQPDTFTAKANCSEPVGQHYGLPVFAPVDLPLVWIKESPSAAPYVTARHWCAHAQITVAVKAAAWESPVFRTVGFYAQDRAISPGEGRFTDYAKADPRLVVRGERHLKNGEKVFLLEFIGAGPCTVNGSGDNPTHSLEFKPFVTYEGGYRRWEDVSSNHGVKIGQEWSREADLLQ